MAFVFGSSALACCPPHISTLECPIPPPLPPFSVEQTGPSTAELTLASPVTSDTEILVTVGGATIPFSIPAGSNTATGTIMGTLPPLPATGTFVVAPDSPGCPPQSGTVTVTG